MDEDQRAAAGDGIESGEAKWERVLEEWNAGLPVPLNPRLEQQLREMLAAVAAPGPAAVTEPASAKPVHPVVRAIRQVNVGLQPGLLTPEAWRRRGG
jgi:hypothetical protein